MRVKIDSRGQPFQKKEDESGLSTESSSPQQKTPQQQMQMRKQKKKQKKEKKQKKKKKQHQRSSPFRQLKIPVTDFTVTVEIGLVDCILWDAAGKDRISGVRQILDLGQVSEEMKKKKRTKNKNNGR